MNFSINGINLLDEEPKLKQLMTLIGIQVLSINIWLHQKTKEESTKESMITENENSEIDVKIAEKTVEMHT